MAFTASTNWRVINGGSDGSTGFGGGFDTGVSGMATDGAATSATTGSPVFSSASYNFVAGDVGAWVYIKSGTNWIAGWYKIASVASNQATLTATIGTATLSDGGLNTATGCATTASPTGATWSVDYSLQTAAQVTFTDMVIDAVTNTNFTSVATPAAVNWIGNIIAVSSGTGFTVQRVAITSISGLNYIADKSMGTLASTGGNGKLGAAFASIGQAGAVFVASNTVWVKYNATAFSSTSTTANTTNGRLSLTAGTVTAPSIIRGFDVTPGDTTTNRPTLKWGVNAASNALTASPAGGFCIFENLIYDCNRANFTSTRGISMSGATVVVRRCKLTSAAASAIAMTSAGGNMQIFQDLEITDCASAAAIAITNTTPVVVINSFIHDNTNDGINSTSTGQISVVNTIFSTNKNAAANSGIALTSTARLYVDNCDFYNSGSHGIDLQAATQAHIENSHFEANGGYGINTVASGFVYIFNNGYYNNTSGTYPSSVIATKNVIGDITLSGTGYTNAAGNDFSKNNTASQGALLRAAAFPASYTGSSTNNYRDVGAPQHQDAGGGTTTIMNVME